MPAMSDELLRRLSGEKSAPNRLQNREADELIGFQIH